MGFKNVRAKKPINGFRAFFAFREKVERKFGQLRMTTVNKFEGDRSKYFCARTLNNLCNFGNKAQQILNAAGRFIREFFVGTGYESFKKGKRILK